jgi:hypothetical protein
MCCGRASWRLGLPEILSLRANGKRINMSAPAQGTNAQTTPNQYHLHGRGINVAYFPDGFGPPHTNGPLHLTYRDSVRSLAFYGDEVRLVDVPDLGKVVSVTIVPVIEENGATTFSLLVPDVVLQNPMSPVHIQTLGITTFHAGFNTVPERETYTVTELRGTAVAGILPL